MTIPVPGQTPAALREALRLISYGLYVVTAARENEVHAITFNWLTQVSFSPLLVLAAVENASHTRALLAATGIFAVNFLGAHQVDLARRMAVPHRMNPHKLAGIAYTVGANGAPLLAEALGYV
ncbi:MAG: flavin reductase, partial [Anaerolineales bacterium]|nr:flavin reductase [Anaerolineales bacterium]